MYCCFTPLINFDSSEPQIRLANNLVIDRPTVAENKLIKSYHTFGSPELLGEWKFVIRCDYKKAVDEWLSVSTVVRTIRCFRLFKNNIVGNGQIYTFDKLKDKCLGESSFRRPHDSLHEVAGIYKLRKKELPAFLRLHNKFLNLGLEKNLRIAVAVERFDKTYEEGLRDIPIDVMIGLEALYLSDNQELAYKMAMRAAYLLGSTNEQQRQSIFAEMKKAYDIRSKLVHGIWVFADPKNSSAKFDAQLKTVASARNILRESIKKFIDLLSVYSHDQLLKNILDNNILSKQTKL